MSWGSFLVGGCVFGFVAFVVGILVGSSHRQRQEDSLEMVIMHLSSMLEIGQYYHLSIAKDADEDDDSDMDNVPMFGVRSDWGQR